MRALFCGTAARVRGFSLRHGRALCAGPAFGAVTSQQEAMAEIVGLFGKNGDTLYDTSVTQLQHALQTAALAQSESGADADVCAALLHDIGHLALDEHMDAEDGFLEEDLEHERVGSLFLRRCFGDDVTRPVDLHVEAKRYLCATRDGYWDALSNSSKRSLEVQGGAFTAEEAEAWITQDGAEAAVRLRLWDDCAKVQDLDTPPLDAFLGAVERCVTLPAQA